MRELSLEVQQVVELVDRSINLDGAELSDEFFPTHLSIALIDAIFNPQLKYEEQVRPIIERYCCHFGLRWFRVDRQNLPSVGEQETLTDLINHYEKYGMVRMMNEVFRARYCSPGTKIRKAENVYRAAVALRSVEIDNLQDAASARPEAIKYALLP